MLTPPLTATAVVLLAVLAALGWALHRTVTGQRHATVLDELGLTRALVAAGDFRAARRAHERAESAHRRGMPLEDTDATLLALGPMALLEPGPVRPVIERGDPLGIVATTVMRSVAR